MRLRVILAAAALVMSASTALAQKAVFVLRHGEKFSEQDERLTDAGKARAARLASSSGSLVGYRRASLGVAYCRGFALPPCCARRSLLL